MTTILTLTVTLHESIYQNLDRVVEYEVDEQYRQKYGDVVDKMLHESIECNENEWHRLLQKGYKGSIQRGTINFDSIWYDVSVILEDLVGIDDLDLEIDRRECRFIMKYERLNEELTIYDMEQLADMLGRRVLAPQCVESVEFETTNWLIPECVVHLKLERDIHAFHVNNTIDIKEEVN